MPRRYQMGALVQRCQRRADKENDPQVDPSVGGEWYALVSAQYAELYSLVAGTGLRYFETVASYITTGLSYLTEPADHFETVGIDHVLTGGLRRPLAEAMSQDQDRFGGLTGDALAYGLVDDRCYLYPVPPAGQTYEWLYVPQPPDLTTYLATDGVDVVNPAGEEFLIWGVAVKALSKSESDVTLAMAEREKFREYLIEWAQMRALTSPRRRVIATGLDEDVNNRFDPGGWWNR